MAFWIDTCGFVETIHPSEPWSLRISAMIRSIKTRLSAYDVGIIEKHGLPHRNGFHNERLKVIDECRS